MGVALCIYELLLGSSFIVKVEGAVTVVECYSVFIVVTLFACDDINKSITIHISHPNSYCPVVLIATVSFLIWCQAVSSSSKAACAIILQYSHCMTVVTTLASNIITT
jgi:hypothetical protein